MRRFDQNRQWDRNFQGSRFSGQGQRYGDNRAMNTLQHQYGNMNISSFDDQQRYPQSSGRGILGILPVPANNAGQNIQRFSNAQRFSNPPRGGYIRGSTFRQSGPRNLHMQPSSLNSGQLNFQGQGQRPRIPPLMNQLATNFTSTFLQNQNMVRPRQMDSSAMRSNSQGFPRQSYVGYSDSYSRPYNRYDHSRFGQDANSGQEEHRVKSGSEFRKYGYPSNSGTGSANKDDSNRQSKYSPSMGGNSSNSVLKFREESFAKGDNTSHAGKKSFEKGDNSSVFNAQSSHQISKGKQEQKQEVENISHAGSGERTDLLKTKGNEKEGTNNFVHDKELDCRLSKTPDDKKTDSYKPTETVKSVASEKSDSKPSSFREVSSSQTCRRNLNIAENSSQKDNTNLIGRNLNIAENSSNQKESSNVPRRSLNVSDGPANQNEGTDANAEVTNKGNTSRESSQNFDKDEHIMAGPSLVDDRYSFKPLTLRELNLRDHEDDDRAGGSDLDIDDSDDDELEQPSFLVSLEEARNRPIPGTPTKFTRLDVSQSSNPDSPHVEEEMYRPQKKTTLKSGLSLDLLLAEKCDKPDELKEYEEIHAELKKDIKKGGFVQETLEEEEDVVEDELLPEHQVQLQHFQVSKSSIHEVHPGEEIFDPRRYRQIFTQCLRPQDCGFTPGSTYIDNYLSTVLPDNYMSLLSSDILMMCFDNVSCPDAVCRWLYYIMSIHNSHLVINGCCKILEDNLNNEIHYTQANTPTWCPTAKDLLTVLLNCGASVDMLLPSAINISGREELKESVQVLNRDDGDNQDRRYNRENLRLAIRVLALCLQARPKQTSQQLTCMLMMLCKAALDHSLNNFMLTYEIQVCIASMLQCYTLDEWQSQAPHICNMLSSVTSHHHNQVYLSQLFPHGVRGGYIQRRISYITLNNIFSLRPLGIDQIDNFKLKDLKCILPKLRELAGSNLNKHSVTTDSNPADLYKLASALSLLDMSVGNSILKATEKEDLQFLTDQLKKITGDVRDNVRTLDRSKVKDLMVRVTSKWTLVLLTVGSKQRSIFSYYPSKQQQEVHIETVQSTQSDHESDQSSDELESEGMENINLDTKATTAQLSSENFMETTSQCSNENKTELKTETGTNLICEHGSSEGLTDSCDKEVEDIEMSEELPEL